MTENLINLLFSKFELSLSSDNSYQVDYVDYFLDWFYQKTCEFFTINELNENSLQNAGP